MDALMQNKKLEGGDFFKVGSNDVLIILLHGLTATTVEVRPLANALHLQGFSVAAPLLPGHNTTPVDLNSRKWYEWTDTVSNLINSNSEIYPNIFIGGESMGGLVTLYMASKFPQLQGILLYSPAIRIKNIFLSSLIRIFKKFIPKKSYEQDDVVNEGEFPWKGYRVNPTSAVYQLYKLQKEVRKRLVLIHQPTIIFQGKLDTTIDPSGASLIYDNINSPYKELIVLENSGHCVVLEKEHNFVFEKSIEFINKQLALQK